MTLSFKNPPTLIAYDDGNTQLVLKPARVVDAAPLVTAIEESLTELRQFMPWAHYPQTLEAQTKRLDLIEKDFGKNKDLIFHIYRRINFSLLIPCTAVLQNKSITIFTICIILGVYYMKAAWSF